MHYYEFHIGDYQADTAHLDNLEDLAYRRLLDLYYKEERPIPLDVEQVARLIRMRSECERIAGVLREFFVEGADGWINHRAQEQLEAKYRKSEAAKRSAEARWKRKTKGNQKVTDKKTDDTDGMRTHSERNANSMLPNTQYPIPNTQYKEQVPDAAGASTDLIPVDQSFFISLPTNRHNTQGEEYRITDDQVAEWSQIYPAVDVQQELRNMLGWLTGNAAKRKTKRGMPAFINRWLSKAQDQGGSGAAARAPAADKNEKRSRLRERLRDIHDTDW